MRNASFALVAAFSLLAFPACGGGDGNDNNNDPDAGGGGGGEIDGGGGGGGELTGIGEQCSNPGECTEPETDLCLGLQGLSLQFCSFECATDRQITSDGDGQVPLSEIPMEDHQKCSTAYNGSAGAAACGVITEGLPQGGPEPNTEYTVSAACVVLCDQQMQCPTGYSCNQGLCDVN